MDKEIQSPEDPPSDFNLSLHKTPLSTLSDSIPSFGPGNRNNNQNQFTSSQPIPETSDKGPNVSTKTLRDRIISPEPLIIQVADAQPKRCSSAKHRQQQPWKATLRGYEKNGYSPHSSTFGSSFYSSLQNKTREISKNRDVSPATSSDLSQCIDKKTLNRSFELRASNNALNKEIQNRGKATGKLVLDMKNQRKEMETQLANLEKRICRLKEEEASALKKMERASSQVEKTRMVQTRKKEEAEERKQRMQAKEEDAQKRRAEINNQREKAKMNSSNAVLEMLRGRYMNALAMKKEAEERQAQEAEKKMYEEERKKTVRDGVKSWLDASKIMNNANRDYEQKKKSLNYLEKAKLERAKAEELMEKSRLLEDLERDIVTELVRIQEKQIAKFSELEDLQRNSIH